jgi:acetyl-CoA synthetase
VAESAIVGIPTISKGILLYGFHFKETYETRDPDNLRREINQLISERIGPIATKWKNSFYERFAKTRSGKLSAAFLAQDCCWWITVWVIYPRFLTFEVVQEIIDTRL